MGASQSAEKTAESSTSTPAEPQAGPQATQLFKFEQSGGAGSWERYSASVSWDFVNVNADSRSLAAKWQIEAGELETEVSDQFVCELAQQRCIIGTTAGDAWALKFPTAVACQAFADKYNACLFENTYEKPYTDAERAQVFGNDSVLGRGNETDESARQWQDDVDMPEAAPPGVAERYRRSSAIGTPGKQAYGVRMGAGANSYVVRDKQIEVLRNVHGGVRASNLSFNVTPPRGSSSFTPNKLMLMNREQRMNMLSPDKGDRLYHTDIETGKVVSEWGFEKDGLSRGMVDMVNDSKGAQLDSRDTFLGIGSKTLNRWDMRAPEGIVQEMASPSVMGWQAGHDYKTNVKFTCMATSGDGYVVIGSEDGQVRMFSETDKALSRAKTSIPGLGAPITSVDVTYDGKWVVATTKSYLMVIKTSYRDKGGKETNGFKGRMGANAPAPRLLRLKPEDMAKVGGAPLRTGRFTWVTEAGRQERWIVASVGSYTVLWNFRTVKLCEPTLTSYGGLTTCTEYHLSQKPESVVDSVFMHDNYAPSPHADENSMVVVTKHQVYSLADDDE